MSLRNDRYTGQCDITFCRLNRGYITLWNQLQCSNVIWQMATFGIKQVKYSCVFQEAVIECNYHNVTTKLLKQ